jgi:hypothetical protein
MLVFKQLFTQLKACCSIGQNKLACLSIVSTMLIITLKQFIKHLLNPTFYEWCRLDLNPRPWDDEACVLPGGHSIVLLPKAGNIKGGKYHCTIDLLFDWFGQVCFA